MPWGQTEGASTRACRSSGGRCERIEIGNLNICERLLARDNQCRGGLAACSTLVASQKAAVGRAGWTCNWGSFSSFSYFSVSFFSSLTCRKPSLSLGQVKLQQRMFARHSLFIFRFETIHRRTILEDMKTRKTKSEYFVQTDPDRVPHLSEQVEIS